MTLHRHLILILLLTQLVCSCRSAEKEKEEDKKKDPGQGRVYVQKAAFHLDGQPIYFNGVNTPFHTWDEFGSTGTTGYDRKWWDGEFARLKEARINSTRIWISCSGTALPRISGDGYVTGVNAQFWKDVDHLMETARRHKIYVIATMMSFDHTKSKKASYDPRKTYLAWRRMFTSKDRIQSMIDTYLLPFASRYKDNPYLFAIDLCNEPEWINQNAECGKLSWKHLQRYVAMSAAAIHASESKVLVTVGSASIKWDRWNDKDLQAQHKDSQAFLDFYQIHWYLWMEKWYPLLSSPVRHKVTDRPLVLGELPARNGDKLPKGVTLQKTFEFLFKTGYSGHCPWTSNGIDKNGGLDDLRPISKAFQAAHSDRVRFGP